MHIDPGIVAIVKNRKTVDLHTFYREIPEKGLKKSEGANWKDHTLRNIETEVKQLGEEENVGALGAGLDNTNDRCEWTKLVGKAKN